MMKLSNFRVRQRLNIKSRVQKQQNHEDLSSKQDQLKLSSLLKSFQDIITSLVSSHSKSSSELNRSASPLNSQLKQIDYRDRFVTVKIPDFQNTEIDKKKLQVWAGEVCAQTLSTAFHYFMEKKLSYDQMKAFASQNILRNLVYLAESYKLSPQEIKFIDDTLKEKVFPYLKTKYPLTVEKEINKSLSNAVKSIDNSDLPTNDYFFTSQIEFQLRENGRYDDIIMHFLNQIMTKIDQKNKEDDETNYKQFKKVMESIFEKSFDKNWIETGSFQLKQNQYTRNIVKQQQEYKQYKEMVKSYTSYAIGRKISQNTQIYSEQEIKNRSLSIKSPAILRILTKWCQELWNKFEDHNYFMKRNDGFVMLSTKKIGILTPYSKEVLSKYANLQKYKIQQFLSNIESINYEQQIQILENELTNDEESYIEKYERITGKFSCKLIKSIESFIIEYLNLLIHSLMNVSKNCYNQYQKQYDQWWPFQFNLISFNVSDLLRCKYASKEKEVLKIFNLIHKISNDNPDLLKIIRIKNRLKNATNDIMINAKFNNSINCEIQIAVNATHTEFIDCSNKINHYIYEMERAKFGPILEMCSIWKTYDKRSEAFDKLIQKEKPRKKHVKSHEQCKSKNEPNLLIPLTTPFVCSECSKHYYRNKYIVNHLKCKNCDYWKCAVCTIKQNFDGKNREFFFEGNRYKKDYKFWKQKDKVPDNGACILINKPRIEVMIFKKYKDDFKQLLIHRKDNQSAILREISSKKDFQKLFEDCLIFDLDQTLVNRQVRYENIVFEQSIRSDLIIPSLIQKRLKEQKETISIMNEQALSKVNMNKVISKYLNQCKNIKQLQFYNSKLYNLDQLVPDFVNLTALNISANYIQDITPICRFTKLQKLQIISNNLSELPPDIINLRKIQELRLFGNRLRSLPEYFCKLSSLKVINLKQNRLEDLPANIQQLINLKELNLNQNEFETFPEVLEKLPKLELLSISNNKIKQISQEIKGFSTLKSLDLSFNYLSKLPTSMNEMINLTILNLQQNIIQQIPFSIKSLSELQKLNMSKNQLKTIPDELGELSKLIQLNFLSNQLTSLNPCIFRLKNLEELNIRLNKISEILNSFDKLTKLKILNFSHNQLIKWPSTVKSCPLVTFQFEANFFEDCDIFWSVKKSLNGEIQISYFRNLKKIYCSEEVGQFNLIKKFKFNNNQLEEYPDFINMSQKVEEIDLESNKISRISNTFKDGNQLTVFSLEDNLLSQLPLSFTYLKLLQVLKLDVNNFEVFPQQILSLQNLEYLSMRMNKLKEIPQKIVRLQKLEEIDISLNQIQYLPSAFGQMPVLQKLIAERNEIKEIPLEICRSKSIRRLDLNSNKIQIVPKQINQMVALGDDSSYINSNPLREVGDQVFMSKKFHYWQQIKFEIEKRNSLANTLENDTKILENE